MIKPIRIKKEKPVDEPMDHIVLTDKISVHTYIRRKKKMVSIALTTDLDGEPLAVADLNLHEARLVHAALGVHIKEFG